MYKKILSSLLLSATLSFPLKAMQTLKTGLELTEKITRKAFIFIPLSKFGKEKDQSMKFVNPMRDSVAKYLLDDEAIRNSFIGALTPYKNVKSSTKIDASLRPLKFDQNLLNILQDQSLVKAIKTRINKNTDMKEDSSKQDENEKILKNFDHSLLKNLPDIQKVLLDEKGPISDIICKLDNGDYVLVEIQVNNPGDYVWDKRAWAYSSLLFGGQLRKGEAWKNLHSVVAINILGTGQEENKSFWKDGEPYKKHFDITDKLNRNNKIEAIELIQYSLGNLELEKIKSLEERAWLDFFKNASKYDHIPHNSPALVQEAYKRIQRDTLPLEIKTLYDTEEKELSNYSVRFEEERNIGKLEEKKQIALKMLSRGRPIKEIEEDTGLSEQEIEGLKRK